MNRKIAQRWIASMVVLSLFLGACGANSPAELPKAGAVAESVPAGGEESAAPSSASDGPLTASADSAISVQLEWKPVDGATGYDVEFSMGGEERLLLASLDASVTSFEDFGVPEGVPLTYHLMARETGETYAVTVATELAPANPYSVEPVYETADLPFGDLDPALLESGEFDPSTFDFGDFDPSTFDPSTFDPSMLEGLDPMALLQPGGAAATIGPQGGELTAEAADGARYTLSIPAGALEYPVFVQMTPIESLGGYPFSGGIYGAVEIAPTGLELNELATLAIEPSPDAASAFSQEGLVDVAFGFGSSGENFHLTPLSEAASDVSSLAGGKLARVARQPHAAGPLAKIYQQQLESQGIGTAKPGEVREFAKQNPPRDGASRAAQKLAAGQAQRAGGAKGATALSQEAQRLSLQAGDANTCEEIYAAFQAYEAYVNSGAAASDSPRAAQKILDDLVGEAESIRKNESKRCLKPDDCLNALGAILTSPIGPAQQSLSKAHAAKYPAEKGTANQDTNEQSKRCRLQLRIDSETLSVGGTSRAKVFTSVEVTIPLKWSLRYDTSVTGNGVLKGQGRVRYTGLMVDNHECNPTFSPQPEGSQDFIVFDLTAFFDDKEGRLEDFELGEWDVWGPPEDFQAQCPSGAREILESRKGGGGCGPWCLDFNAARADSRHPAEWTIVSQGERPGVIATREFERKVSGTFDAGLWEITTFTIERVE